MILKLTNLFKKIWLVYLSLNQVVEGGEKGQSHTTKVKGRTDLEGFNCKVKSLTYFLT